MANNKIITGLVVALIVAFFALFMTPSQYVPYTPAKNYAKYEAFTEGADKEATKEATKEKKTEEAKSDAGPTASAGSVMGTLSQLMQTNPVSPVKSNTAAFSSMTNNVENMEPMVEIPRTIEYGPLHDSGFIDKFSQVTVNGVDGINGCVSSGLSNSGGPICLTPELIQLLKTRGGNAAGTN